MSVCLPALQIRRGIGAAVLTIAVGGRIHDEHKGVMHTVSGAYRSPAIGNRGRYLHAELFGVDIAVVACGGYGNAKVLRLLVELSLVGERMARECYVVLGQRVEGRTKGHWCDIGTHMTERR